MRDNVLQFLNEQGWPDPPIGFSGNGYWLAYRVDMGNDDQAKELVEEVLQTVAFFFDEEDVKIDPAVANAARLMPFFGTMKMKGENTREEI